MVTASEEQRSEIKVAYACYDKDVIRATGLMSRKCDFIFQGIFCEFGTLAFTKLARVQIIVVFGNNFIIFTKLSSRVACIYSFCTV